MMNIMAIVDGRREQILDMMDMMNEGRRAKDGG